MTSIGKFSLRPAISSQNMRKSRSRNPVGLWPAYIDNAKNPYKIHNKFYNVQF